MDDLKYYTIKLEAFVPTEIEYRVLASNPEEALELIAKKAPNNRPKQRLSRMKKIKAQVYLAGTTIIKLSRKF